MKLFKNNVGRPSNETKKKRRLFVLGTITLSVAAGLLVALLISSISINNLSGKALGNYSGDVDGDRLVTQKDAKNGSKSNSKKSKSSSKSNSKNSSNTTKVNKNSLNNGGSQRRCENSGKYWYKGKCYSKKPKVSTNCPAIKEQKSCDGYINCKWGFENCKTV